MAANPYRYLQGVPLEDLEYELSCRREEERRRQDDARRANEVVIKCYRCLGLGHVQDEDGHRKQCFLCSGSGRLVAQKA